MSENKVKIEISKLTLVFIILFGLCVIVWSFIIGIWVGTKISGKEEGISFEEKSKNLEIPPSQTTAFESSNKSIVKQGSFPLSKPSSSSENFSKTNKIIPFKKTISKSSSVSSKKSVQVEPKYVRKKVAYVASQIKHNYYAIQVAAFSNKKSAEKMKQLAEKKGYKAVIKVARIKEKTFYKVLIGNYSSKEEARKYISKVSADLGIKKPFIIKVK